MLRYHVRDDQGATLGTAWASTAAKADQLAAATWPGRALTLIARDDEPPQWTRESDRCETPTPLQLLALAPLTPPVLVVDADPSAIDPRQFCALASEAFQAMGVTEALAPRA